MTVLEATTNSLIVTGLSILVFAATRRLWDELHGPKRYVAIFGLLLFAFANFLSFDLWANFFYEFYSRLGIVLHYSGSFYRQVDIYGYLSGIVITLALLAALATSIVFLRICAGWKKTLFTVTSILYAALTLAAFSALMVGTKSFPPQVPVLPDDDGPGFPGLDPLSHLIKKLDWGGAAVNVPPKMRHQRPYELTLVVAPTLSPTELQKEVEHISFSSGVDLSVDTSVVKVHDRMKATVRGNGLQVVPLTPETQVVAKMEKTTWRWQIKPVVDRRVSVFVSLSAMLLIDGEQTSYVVHTTNRDIEVEIPLTERVQLFLWNRLVFLGKQVELSIAVLIGMLLSWQLKRISSRLTSTSLYRTVSKRFSKTESLIWTPDTASRTRRKN